jgi:hypothetical protein
MHCQNYIVKKESIYQILTLMVQQKKLLKNHPVQHPKFLFCSLRWQNGSTLVLVQNSWCSLMHSEPVFCLSQAELVGLDQLCSADEGENQYAKTNLIESLHQVS